MRRLLITLACFTVWLFVRVWAVFRPIRRIKLDGSPYIDRYFLTSTPSGDSTGTPGWYLQRIHCPDADRRLHCHPWVWANSWILRGGYREVRELRFDGETGLPLTFEVPIDYLPGDTNTLLEGDYHQIVRVWGECWTLFYAGPKHGRGWGFK